MNLLFFLAAICLGDAASLGDNYASIDPISKTAEAFLLIYHRPRREELPQNSDVFDRPNEDVASVDVSFEVITERGQTNNQNVKTLPIDHSNLGEYFYEDTENNSHDEESRMATKTNRHYRYIGSDEEEFSNLEREIPSVPQPAKYSNSMLEDAESKTVDETESLLGRKYFATIRPVMEVLLPHSQRNNMYRNRF